MTDEPLLRGRCASFATKHDKWELVGPVMREVAGLVVRPVPVDTDTFGTFTGEVDRWMSPFDTAVAKARLGMEESGLSIGLASEGSIGVGRFAPLVSDMEMVVIVDDVENFVLGEVFESPEVLTYSWRVKAGSPPPSDLSTSGFPRHGLIVRPEGAFEPVVKGIHDRQTLLAALEECVASGSPWIRIESDLRADHCPSRRPVIAEAARRLAVRLNRPCPGCGCPGWGRVDVVRGLRCEHCRRPTRGVSAEVFGCPRCELTRIGPECRQTADPATCDHCNP